MTIPPGTLQCAPEQVIKLLESLAFLVGRARHSSDPEAIHDLRVGIRRFEQSLVLFKSCFVAKDLKKIRRRLRSMMHLAGEVRDYDIALRFFSKMNWPEAKAMSETLHARRKEVDGRLLAALKKWVMGRTSSKWPAMLTVKEDIAPTADDAGEATRRLPKMAGTFLKRGEWAADSRASAEDLHRFRITTKKFRYRLEL